MAKLAPKKSESDSVDDPKTSVQLTQLTIDFQIDTVNLSISQMSKDKNSNADEKIFYFVLDRLSASTAVRTFDLTGIDIVSVTVLRLRRNTPL